MPSWCRRCSQQPSSRERPLGGCLVGCDSCSQRAVHLPCRHYQACGHHSPPSAQARGPSHGRATACVEYQAVFKAAAGTHNPGGSVFLLAARSRPVLSSPVDILCLCRRTPSACKRRDVNSMRYGPALFPTSDSSDIALTLRWCCSCGLPSQAGALYCYNRGRQLYLQQPLLSEEKIEKQDPEGHDTFNELA